MPQPSEAEFLRKLTEVPAGWPLATVIDAFVYLAAYRPGQAKPDRAREQVSFRLVELWASQPEQAEAWLERCRERFAAELAAQATRRERLCEALLRHGAAEFGKYGYVWRFSEAGLLRELRPAAEQESKPAEYLHSPTTRDRCRELAERLVAAESTETARKRQKLEEETSERRRLEAELQKSQQEECRDLRNRLAAAKAEVSGKEAELQRSQEERRELRNRLAAAEAEVSSKTAELQTAQTESAECKEQCKELEHRATSAESVVAEMRKELQQLQGEHSKCQERCEDLANRLQAAVTEHAEANELLVHDATEKQLNLQQQVESCGYHALCLPVSAPEESKAELQLEKAVLQGRYDQLKQQLAKAEAKVDLLQALREEIGMYKERLRGQVVQTRTCHRLDGGTSGQLTQNLRARAPSDAALDLDDEKSDLAEQLGYSLVDEDRASVLSGSSGCSVKQNCFMLDAVFKSRMDLFREGRDLQKGSQVLAGDGKTVLEVVEISKEGQATEVVDLQADSATLRVTPDHPVQIPDESGEPGRHVYMPAGKLKAGDFVMLDSGEPVALTSAETQPSECKVLKIVFKPDLPVAVFSSPSCILSKGHKKKSQVRRSGMGMRGKDSIDPMDGSASIPDTAAGEYMD